MGQDHGHSHSHTANKKTLTISLVIITTYMVVEVVGGFLTNSLALLADAGHMLSDAISLFIALMAFKFSSKIADYSKTYGYKRFEILAAVINGATLILISVYIIYEAIERFQSPPEIQSGGMLIVAIVGLLVNVLVAWIMMRGADVKENLNMRGAYLHVISDMLGSVGAIIAALLIMFFGWGWADPLASVIVSILVLRSGYLVTKSSVHVLMEGTPENVEVDKVNEKILKTDGIKSIHDLHIWTITSGLNALTCHAVVNEKMTIEESEILLRKVEHELEHMNIHHVTIQLETPAHLHDNSVLCIVKAEPSAHDHHNH
ncbi:cation transporter [Epilithonimonas vandammei]|jgi:cobalt-zinc-cadmium efflux system protein|uniref:Cation transporter n=4 Tax=Flavobacteriales TaxID=200644 RepID=A0A2U8QU78_9FLAO|nr:MULTISPECIES: cation diffusion facilitator family transporter [Bacteroidota]MBF00799.1 cation transporter [Flavobacterium sp.]MCZ2247433.1 cation diffusion facilitator family transporter [Bacteroidia bacterium]MDV3879083.1 cation transporter [Elizabethkingia anophelis]AWM13355.1 cation transporter [Flavobacterium sediminis]AZI55992.1 cation transporter [Epilithonimonas vandammei]|tara:strand:+ start:4898 stop:5848 length:951 start_codon:yes stop_codon:yes gene_type:complete